MLLLSWFNVSDLNQLFLSHFVCGLWKVIFGAVLKNIWFGLGDFESMRANLICEINLCKKKKRKNLCFGYFYLY